MKWVGGRGGSSTQGPKPPAYERNLPKQFHLIWVEEAKIFK